MCEYLKRMSPQGTPTDDIRLWSSLTHSVVEYTGPEPFGMDGSVCLWLHERSATKLLDMCDELDAKFSDLKAENAKLRELARGLGQCAQGVGCEDCLLYDLSEPDHCREERLSRELGIEVQR